MERKISFENLQEVVKSAYELNKSEKGGTIDPRVASDEKAGQFGISVVLTDGRSVDKGDTDALFALGKIARIPLAVVLKTQQAAAAKDGAACTCGCDKGNACSCENHEKKTKLPLGRCGLKAISAIIPQGDPEGKYGVISDMLVALANGEPAFSDDLYKLYQEEVAAMDMVNTYKESDFKLADDVAQCIDMYIRLMSTELTARQLATVGATIAADGRNPQSGEYAFDGAIAADVVAMLATRGKHFARHWLRKTGLPGIHSFAGAIIAILPGFGAIVAYSPELNDCGVSIKAANAIEYIAKQLQLNVFASARVKVE